MTIFSNIIIALSQLLVGLSAAPSPLVASVVKRVFLAVACAVRTLSYGFVDYFFVGTAHSTVAKISFTTLSLLGGDKNMNRNSHAL